MNTIFIKIVVFFSLFAIGCSPVYYKAVPLNMPNFTEKGDVYLAGNIGTSGSDVQAAYSVTDHIFVQGNYISAYDESPTVQGLNGVPTKSTGEGNLTEFAGGYFTKLGEHFAFSVCAGYGSGKVINNRDTEGASFANFDKPFIQSTLGLREKNIEVIASAKFANLKYRNLTQNYTRQEWIDEFNVLKNPIPIVEAGVMVRIGFKRIKFQSQVAIVRLFKWTPLFRHDEGVLSFGLCLQLNPKKDFFTPAQ